MKNKEAYVWMVGYNPPIWKHLNFGEICSPVRHMVIVLNI